MNTQISALAPENDYERYLGERGYAQRTVESYLWVARDFERRFGEPNASALAAYRSWLLGNHKVASANQHMLAINHYLRYLGRDDLCLGTAKTERVPSTVMIDYAAYRRLVRHLRDEGYEREYHAVRLLVTTGLRVGELLGLSVEDVREGSVVVRSGSRERRVVIPPVVAEGVLAWVEGEGRRTGPLFINRYGGVITRRGLSYQLKERALECGVDASLVHPQAFKGLFVRCFLEAAGDLGFLEELLG